MKRQVFRTLAIVAFAFLIGSWAAGALEVITWSPGAPKANETVTFSINGLESDEIVSQWDFGDGESESTDASSGVTHSYDEAGTYTVEVTTKVGLTDLYYSRSITIAE